MNCILNNVHAFSRLCGSEVPFVFHFQYDCASRSIVFQRSVVGIMDTIVSVINLKNGRWARPSVKIFLADVEAEYGGCDRLL